MIKVKRQPEDLSLENMKIAIDAGHGGNNPGASGIATKIGEKNYTLLIAKLRSSGCRLTFIISFFPS